LFKKRKNVIIEAEQIYKAEQLGEKWNNDKSDRKIKMGRNKPEP